MATEEKLSKIINYAEYVLTTIGDTCALLLSNDTDAKDYAGFIAILALIHTYATDAYKKIDIEELEAKKKS